MSEVGNRVNERGRDEGLRFHARFDGGEDANVGIGHMPHYCGIELHGLLF